MIRRAKGASAKISDFLSLTGFLTVSPYFKKLFLSFFGPLFYPELACGERLVLNSIEGSRTGRGVLFGFFFNAKRLALMNIAIIIFKTAILAFYYCFFHMMQIMRQKLLR